MSAKQPEPDRPSESSVPRDRNDGREMSEPAPATGSGASVSAAGARILAAATEAPAPAKARPPGEGAAPPEAFARPTGAGDARAAAREAYDRKSERLAAILCGCRLATRNEIERAIEEQRLSGVKLTDALLKIGAVAKEDLEWALADEFDLKYVRIDPAAIDPAIVRLVPEAFSRAHCALPYARSGQTLVLLVEDPLDRRAVVEARRLTGLDIRPALASHAEIVAALDQVFGPVDRPAAAPAPPGEASSGPAAIAPALGDFVRVEGQRSGGRRRARTKAKRSAGAVARDAQRHLESVLEAAARAGAIRVVLSVRGDGFEAHGVREAGTSTEARSLLLRGDAASGRALLARLQALAGLPPGRPEDPASGSFALLVRDRMLDYDLTVIPALRGELAAIEVRPGVVPPRSLQEVGLLPGDLARLRAVLEARAGLIVLAGEPGQGKTTLFRAMLDHLADRGRRLVVLERAVETPNPAVAHVRWPGGNEASAERWVEAVLRLAPEVAAFDDIPGAGACVRALRAALFGTLVVYSVPLEDAVAACRFLETLPLGRAVAAAALTAIVGVRLVREVCPECRVAAELPIELAAAAQLAGAPAGASYARGRGCPSCSNTGWRGKRPLFEVVAPDKEARARLVEGRAHDIAALFAASRPDSIRVQAVRLASAGMIGVEELGHVL